MAELDITALDTWMLREPVSRRGYCVLRLKTKSGLAGFGECGAVSAAEIETARRVLIGRPATSYEAVRVQLGGAPRAQAGVNMAMLDLVGKFTRAPVYQVLGGPTRHRVRALASLDGVTDEDLVASVKTHHAAGFRAFAVPLPPVLARNQGQAFAETVSRRFDKLRAAAADADFVLDGGASLTPGDAGRVAAAIERLHLLWFDEPCHQSNLSAVRKITDESATALGFGRHIEQPGEVQDALREEVVDILRPDLARHGISQIRRMAALAETYYVAMAPYHEGGPIGTLAALHLAASLPNFFIQHIPVPGAEADRRMRAELTGGPVETVKDGFAPLPTGPGLGVTVHEEALEKYKERAG
jgi:galactonate dehydratase